MEPQMTATPVTLPGYTRNAPDTSPPCPAPAPAASARIPSAAGASLTAAYADYNPRFLNADLVHLDTARSQLEAVIGAIQALRAQAILHPTEGALDDLIAGLTDSKSDLSCVIACAEDAATMKAAAE